MRKYSQPCPVARTLDLIGDRWTMLIIRDLFMGMTKFSELKQRSPAMPPKLLSARLKMLTAEGILRREVYSEHPLRAEYFLTQKGRSLLPIVLALGEWGLEHAFEDDPEARSAVAKVIAERIPQARRRLRKGGYI